MLQRECRGSVWQRTLGLFGKLKLSLGLRCVNVVRLVAEGVT